MNDLDLKLTNAQHRIEQLYNDTNGNCYLSFSGGKDSTVILAIIKMCQDLGTIGDIKAVFCNTGIELQATTDFVNWVKDNWYSNIEIIRSKVSFDWVIKNKGKPMKSKLKSEFIGRYQKNKNSNQLKYLLNTENVNYAKSKIADKDLHIISLEFDIKVSSLCCDYLKKKPFAIYNKTNNVKGYILGERLQEGCIRQLSADKRVQNGGTLCTKTKGHYIVKLPIIDWSDDDIDEFIKVYNIPLSIAYTKYGLSRTGCMGCPFSQNLEFCLEVLYKYEPNKYKASMYWLKDVYIAQGVKLFFDMNYMKEFNEKWRNDYSIMRHDMMIKYRPENIAAKNYEQLTLL